MKQQLQLPDIMYKHAFEMANTTIFISRVSPKLEHNFDTTVWHSEIAWHCAEALNIPHFGHVMAAMIFRCPLAPEKRCNHWRSPNGVACLSTQLPQ